MAKVEGLSSLFEMDTLDLEHNWVSTDETSEEDWDEVCSALLRENSCGSLITLEFTKSSMSSITSDIKSVFPPRSITAGIECEESEKGLPSAADETNVIFSEADGRIRETKRNLEFQRHDHQGSVQDYNDSEGNQRNHSWYPNSNFPGSLLEEWHQPSAHQYMYPPAWPGRSHPIRRVSAGDEHRPSVTAPEVSSKIDLALVSPDEMLSSCYQKSLKASNALVGNTVLKNSRPASTKHSPICTEETKRSTETDFQLKFPSTTMSNGKSFPPLKPLSAYNYFFRVERDRILSGADIDEHETSLSPLPNPRELLTGHWNQDRTRKRIHRKTHGKISFSELSRHISTKWKRLDPDLVKFFKKIAATDLKRYKGEMDAHLGGERQSDQKQ